MPDKTNHVPASDAELEDLSNEYNVRALVEQLFTTSATDEQLKIRLVNNILARDHQTRTALVDEVLGEGPKDRPTEIKGKVGGLGFIPEYEVNPETAKINAAINAMNAAWRSLLLKKKGQS